jgi:hypothetical protein
MEELDLTSYDDLMKSYHLVRKIYEIHNKFKDLEDDPIEYKSINVNLDLLDIIMEVNFVFSPKIGILSKIDKVTKVGVLLNIEVFLEPGLENKVVFNGRENYELIVKI